MLDFRKIKIGDIAAPDQVVDRARFSRAGRSISGGSGCANERTRPCGGRPTAADSRVRIGFQAPTHWI